MEKIFLDIGAHVGESIEIAGSRKYCFEKLIAVEPSSFGVKRLRRFRDCRVWVCDFALGNRDREATLFGAGSVGASLYSDKPPHWNNEESVQIKKFSTWYKSTISPNDIVWIKINIEGAENEIVDELKLIDSENIRSILISFDVEKVPSLKERKRELQKTLVEELSIPFIERNSNFGVQEWLNSFDDLCVELNFMSSFRNSLRFDLPLTRNLRRLIRPLIPRTLWLFTAQRIGPNRKRFHH